MAEPTEAETVQRYMTHGQETALQRGDFTAALVWEAIYKHCLTHPRVLHLAYKHIQRTISKHEYIEVRAHYRPVQNQVDAFLEKEHNSQLLDLPAELRIRVLQFALLDERPMYISGKKIVDGMRPLQVCRLLRKEGSEVFYSLNRFMAPIENDTSRALVDWLRLIEYHNAKRLRSLVLKFCPDPAVVKLIEGHNNDGREDALGAVFYSQDMVLQTLKQKLQHTGLRFESVCGYKFMRPGAWHKGEFIMALAAKHWQERLQRVLKDDTA